MKRIVALIFVVSCIKLEAGTLTVCNYAGGQIEINITTKHICKNRYHNQLEMGQCGSWPINCVSTVQMWFPDHSHLEFTADPKQDYTLYPGKLDSQYFTNVNDVRYYSK